MRKPIKNNWSGPAEAQRAAHLFAQVYTQMGSDINPKFLKGIVSALNYSPYSAVNAFLERLIKETPEALNLLAIKMEMEEEVE